MPGKRCTLFANATYMKNKALSQFQKYLSLNEEETQALLDSMQIGKKRKKEFLLKEGQLPAQSYLVLEGCVRQYFLIDGVERITRFYIENEWIISSDQMLTPSTYYLQASTDVVYLRGNEEQAQKIFERYPHFETAARKIVERTLLENQQRQDYWLTASPEERYLLLLKNQPQLFEWVPQYQLASYIGIQPESLSRIRRRLAGK